ncbi:hypothetical protein EYF80_052779 [Liparis tanakae]|uniref:Uncharacterized protein n=1 Tax=Liparis tanakae TaxID=230148 RepID=A0A4Z2F848_9TELE|nr:hypothetical protein EYF80_052779 [Liparis tanakae]
MDGNRAAEEKRGRSTALWLDGVRPAAGADRFRPAEQNRAVKPSTRQDSSCVCGGVPDKHSGADGAQSGSHTAQNLLAGHSLTEVRSRRPCMGVGPAYQIARNFLPNSPGLILPCGFCRLSINQTSGLGRLEETSTSTLVL